MPVMRILGPGNKVGYRWGSTGKIYYGPDAQQRATRQGQAAYRSGYRPKPGEKLWWTTARKRKNLDQDLVPTGKH
jgi:hypothetical protein